MKKQRIANAFAKAREENRGAFVAYLTMGYPSIEASERAVDDVIAAGADIVEFGVPFSDPFADGGVIRSAAYEALRQGVTLDDILALAGRLRERHPETGFVLFSYYNVIFSKGLEACAEAAEKAGVPVFEYTPMQVKQSVVGYGKAEKKQVMLMTQRLLNMKQIPRPDDAADALALAICHSRAATSLLNTERVFDPERYDTR